MKLKFCFLPLLCLFFRVSGQGKTTIIPADSVRSGTLKIGDRVPDELISKITGLSLDGVPRRVAHISDFRGKLLILDFWATWCAPCRAMVPVMDSLQLVFGDRVVFLPVTYESGAVVEPVLAQMQRLHAFKLPEVTGDTRLHALFPHRSLPHYVWIDGSGKLVAVTEFNEVTAANISAMLDQGGKAAALPEKRDSRVAYDNGKPLFIAGNGGDAGALVYHALLSGYQEGIGSGMNISAFDTLRGQRFTVRNGNIVWLGRLAYANGARWFPNSRIRLESRDSLKMTTRLTGRAFNAWLKAGNGWNYELQVPPYLVRDAFKIIREDLARMFPAYRISVDTQRVRCLVLVRTEGTDKLRSAGGRNVVDVGPYACHLRNAPLYALFVRLERQFMQNSVLPIADGTGYSGMVDLDIEAPLNSLTAVNAALARYGLAFVQQEYPVELLVIRDSDQLKP